MYVHTDICLYAYVYLVMLPSGWDLGPYPVSTEKGQVDLKLRTQIMRYHI